MSNETVVVLTFESIDRILNDGGTSEWRLDRNRARRCAFVVCTRNSNAKPRAEGPEAHRSAFLIGKVSGVVASPGPMRRRCLIQFSEYALSTPAENCTFMAGENCTPDDWVTNPKTPAPPGISCER